jgi:hypothetical protein
MLAGTLAGVEMGLHVGGVPHHRAGVAAAMDVLTGRSVGSDKAAA